MSASATESGIIIEILPPGFTYRVRLSDGREILCGTSRGYFGDRVKIAKKRRPKIGDRVVIRLVNSGEIQGLLVQEGS